MVRQREFTDLFSMNILYLSIIQMQIGHSYFQVMMEIDTTTLATSPYNGKKLQIYFSFFKSIFSY